MFTQTVGMTASDWPISHVVKTSQTIDLNLASLSFFIGIAVSGLILRLKAKEVCSDPDLVKRSFKTCGISNGATT